MTAARSVIVTGGASGIGYAIASLIRQRWTDFVVGLIDLDTATLEGAVRKLGGPTTGVACDVSDHDALMAAVRTAAAGTELVGMVNAAGNHRSCPSIDLTPEDWHEVLGVHLDGTFYGCKAAATLMMEQGTGGSIVNFSSVAKDFAWTARMPYAVAKAGITSLTATLGAEWADAGIRVNAVAPGYINTPMVVSAVERGIIDAEERRLQHAMGRFGEPGEIAEVVEFLLSDRSSFVTSETIRVDGGFSVVK